MGCYTHMYPVIPRARDSVLYAPAERLYEKSRMDDSIVSSNAGWTPEIARRTASRDAVESNSHAISHAS